MSKRFTYQDQSGAPVYVKVRRDSNGEKSCHWEQPDGTMGLGDSIRVPYNLPKVVDAIKNHAWIIWCEGEKCAEILSSMGWVATTAGSAADWKRHMREHFKGAHVAILPDRDEPGRSHADTVARDIVGVADEVKIVPYLADVAGTDADHADVEQFQQKYGDEATTTLRSLVESAPPFFASRAVHFRASDIEPQPIDWLWRGRLPLGKLVVLDGDPGLGKSTLTVDFAARVSTGRPFPFDDQTDRQPAGALIVNLEDGAQDTIRPRLAAAGANLDLVQVLSGIKDAEGIVHPAILPNDFNEIEYLVRRYSAKLVVIDPLMATFSGRIDSHRDQDARRVLTPLTAIAERTGACVVVVRHLNKSFNSNPLYRGGGSIAITAAARVGLLLVRHPQDTSQRLLAVVKNNLGPLPDTVAFRMVSSDGHNCATVDWAATSSFSAIDLVQADRPDGALAEAEEFLREALGGGERFQREVAKEARDFGISGQTLRRARERVCEKPRKTADGWVWRIKRSDHEVSDEHLGHLEKIRQESPDKPQGVQDVQSDQADPSDLQPESSTEKMAAES